ncbi:MAG: hypothetical protein JNM99_06335 [Verrucomicrobiaceae bacterium]|nr:hypothetical protein [Verrucomicrobiaceae bacterium]
MNSLARSTLVAIACLLGFTPLMAIEQPQTAFDQAEKLANDNNHREAANAFKAILERRDVEGRLIAKTLQRAVESLNNLDEAAEAEQVIETAAKSHADQWLVLEQAALSIMQLNHQGRWLNNQFMRSGQSGLYRDATERDRVRAFQLLLAARKAMPADASKADRGRLLATLIAAWGDGRSPSELLRLTDVTTLPDYDESYPWQHQRDEARGYPVDEKGEPVFFAMPASFEAATTDGERLRWALHEWAGVSAGNAVLAKYRWAERVQSWFGVGTLENVFRAEADESATRTSIAAVHTLAEDETTAKLATGPKRFKLPRDYAFLADLREVSVAKVDPKDVFDGDGDDGVSSSRAASASIVSEFLARHQFVEAATELKAAMTRTTDKDELKSLRDQHEQIVGNWGRIENGKPQPAGTKAKLSLVFRNATKAEFSARRVDVAKLLEDTKAYLKTRPQQQEWELTNVSRIGHRLMEDSGLKYLSAPVATWTQDLQPRSKHWDERIEAETPLSEAGAYLVEVSFNGEHTTRALLWIEGLAIVQTTLSDGVHCFVCDAVTGAPVPNAKVNGFGYRAEWKRDGVLTSKSSLQYTFNEATRSTDEHGVVKFSARNDLQWLFVARDAAGRLAYSGFESFYSPGRNAEMLRQSRVFTMTDRPVYRPGQPVKWQLWARQVGYDPKLNTNAFTGDKCEVTIMNPRGEKVSEKTYRVDDSGAVEDTLTLAEDATLGMYRMSIRLNGKEGPFGNHSFRVEEYKKPEFEVKVKAPETPVALGDAFEFSVKADYYFGGAVKEGRVKYKVQRMAHTDTWFPAGRWDWLFGSGYGWRNQSYSWYPGAGSWCIALPRWPWYSWHSDPPELIAQGEQAIGADGTIKVKIDTALAKELHGDEDHRYSIEVKVTDNSRRTIFGKGSVLAARKPFMAYVSLNRGWYQTGDQATASFFARTLDGREVAATGTMTVSKITYAADGTPKEESVHEAKVTLGKDDDRTGTVRTTFKWPQAGQYRVSVKLKDAAGHEVEASTFVVVRGEGFNGKDFRFDDLEVLTAQDEYKPGDEVELLINTNRPGSTVALFVRDSNKDPVWLTLDGKSTSYRFKLSEADQPNVFIDAYTVSNATLHRVTRQIIVPPSKRIASVELVTDKPTYQPRESSKATLRVKDQHGQPFVGNVVLTAYDKALEYISGGSNTPEMRGFFWGWKRSHSISIKDSLRALETGLQKEGEIAMNLWLSSEVVEFDGFIINGGATGAFRSRGVPSGKAAMSPAPMAMVADPRASPAEGRVLAKAAVGYAANAIGGGSGGNEPAEPVMIRSNLADSAVWLTTVKTNDAGEASIDFPLPDTLTTWKLQSWVMGRETQVGEASVEVITRKDLMVRLQAPRFFVEKDEVTISANVHNETDKELGVKALLEVTSGGGDLVALDEGKMPSLQGSIPAHGEKRFDWRAKVKGSGQVQITVKAIAEGASDAMQMSFPVIEHGTLKTDSWSLALRGDQGSGKIEFTVPEERRPELSRLEVRYSPTLAMAMIDALPYLADYPYGCTEQTLNRFVPTVLTLGVLKDLGLDLKAIRDKRVNLNAQEIGDAKDRAKRWQGKNDKGEDKDAVFDESKVQRMARAGLNRLAAMKNNDNGWSWFPGARESSAHITAQVVHGLLAAQRAGMKNAQLDALIQMGTAWLEAHENGELRRMRLPEKDRDHKSQPDNTDALVHSVLAERGIGDKAMRAALYDHRADLSHLNVALLGIAFHQVKDNERRDMCLRNLRQFVKQDDENQTAWLDLPGNGWWFWWHDPIETQAAFLRLLCKVEPKGDLASRIAKHLLNNRRHGHYWNSTRDTAAVIEALADYTKASGESKPDLKLDVVLDGEVKKSLAITAENLFAFDGSFVLDGMEVKSGKHTLEFRKQGGSPLYANAYLTVYSKEDMIPAAGLEVKVNRKFYKLVEQKTTREVSGSRGQVVAQQSAKYQRIELASGDPLVSGDLVEVELSIESKNDYEYVLIADPKPAGFEPVDVQSGWSWTGLSAYREFRDEKVAFFADRLPQGTHNVSYRVKAEIPGKFSALPTKAEAMYAPELRANAAEWKAAINDR